MSLAEEFNKSIIDDSIDLDKMELAVAELSLKSLMLHVSKMYG